MSKLSLEYAKEAFSNLVALLCLFTLVAVLTLNNTVAGIALLYLSLISVRSLVTLFKTNVNSETKVVLGVASGVGVLCFALATLITYYSFIAPTVGLPHALLLLTDALVLPVIALGSLSRIVIKDSSPLKLRRN